MRTRRSKVDESPKPNGDESSVHAAPEAAPAAAGFTINDNKKRNRKEFQKKIAKDMRKRNLGVGLVIESDSANYKKITFDSDEEFAEAVDAKEKLAVKSDDGSDSDDDAVEEVALEDSRKAVLTQRGAERVTKQLSDTRGRKSKRKKAKPEKLSGKEGDKGDDDSSVEVNDDEQQPGAKGDSVLDEDLFALLDADRMSSSKRRKTGSNAETIAATGKRTTFVVEGQSSSDYERIKADYNIELVVLKGKSSQTHDPMGCSIGTQPSATALRLSRNGGNLSLGLKRNSRVKYGIARGRPSKIFTK